MWGVAPLVFAGEFQASVCVSGRMLFRAALVLVVLGAMGCISLRDATLISTQVSLETFNAPVKCGPVGFRRVPLESRFGEYVRVTVAAPVSLKGTAFIHADGVAQEPREWVSSAESPLVIEARFENSDPDKLVALNSDRPIDITITGLEAPEGGTCEGAVFTLEHGRLVAPVDDSAWLAELVRRGGPELLARREAARLLEEERRQAHYAEWKAQSATDEELALREARRLAHYAAWEAERHPAELVVDEAETAIATAEEWNEYAPGHAVSDTTVVMATCASGVCDAVGAPAVVVAAHEERSGCPDGACGVIAREIETASVGLDVSESAFELAAAPAGCATSACAVPTTTCTSGGCAPAHGACVGGACAVSETCHSGSCAGAAVACGSTAGGGAHVELTTPATWAAYPPASGGGGNVAAGGVAGSAEEWVMPPTADVSWEQPYAALETRVAVSERERLRPGLIPVPPPEPCASCADAAVEFDIGFIPALFGAVFSATAPVGVAPPSPRPAQPPHGAVPVPQPATRR